MKRKIRVRDRDRSEDKILDSYLTDAFVGVLAADEIKALSGAFRLTVEETVVQILPRAAVRSVTPVKGQQTASACRCSSGSIYFGCQMEFQTETEFYSISAEQLALANALSNGETDIRAFISSHPVSTQSLGYLNEWQITDSVFISYPGIQPQLIQQLLPQDYSLIYNDPIKTLGNTPEKMVDNPDKIKTAACQAYARSHGPYTNTKAGIALEGNYQKLFLGSYLESTSDHSGVNPLGLALGNLIMADQGFGDIRQVSLMLQKSNNEALIQQTEAILRSVSEVKLDVNFWD